MQTHENVDKVRCTTTHFHRDLLFIEKTILLVIGLSERGKRLRNLRSLLMVRVLF